MKKIAIVVGHGRSKAGGYDSGAVSPDGRYHEFRIAREIASAANAELRRRGIDSTLINYDGNIYLTDRISRVNAGGYDFAAEIHLNAGGGTGSEVYYSTGSQTGKKAAQAVSRAIATEFSARNRGAKTKLNDSGKDYFAFIRSTKPTAVLVETLFIDTPADLDKLKTPEGQQKCGNAIAQALVESLALTAREQSFLVRVIADELNVRSGAGTQNEIVTTVKKGDAYTIVATDGSGKWGKLKSGAGWISLGEKYVERVKR